jgi:hypothetical protein
MGVRKWKWAQRMQAEQVARLSPSRPPAQDRTVVSRCHATSPLMAKAMCASIEKGTGYGGWEVTTALNDTCMVSCDRVVGGGLTPCRR